MPPSRDFLQISAVYGNLPIYRESYLLSSVKPPFVLYGSSGKNGQFQGHTINLSGFDIFIWDAVFITKVHDLQVTG